MARVQLSAIIDDIRGKVGNSTFSIWKGIHLVKSRPVNFNFAWGSDYNWEIRNACDLLAYRWKRLIGGYAKLLWQQYADFLGALGGFYAPGAVQMIPGLAGYVGTMSGFNAYVLTNMLRRSVGLADFLDDAPLGEWFPTRPDLLTFDYTFGPPAVLDITLTPMAPQALDFWLVVWCRGKSLAHLLIAKYLRGENVGATSWSKMHYARGVEHDILPDDYQVQCIYITEKGTFSPFSNFMEFRVPFGFLTKKWDAWMWDGYAWN